MDTQAAGFDPFALTPGPVELTAVLGRHLIGLGVGGGRGALAPPAVVLCGSYRRDLPGLHAAWSAIRDAGALIVSPAGLDFVGERDGFVYSAEQEGTTDAELEAAHLAAIGAADLVWLHDPEGYVGASASLELGFAAASQTPVYAATRPAEPVYTPFVRVVAGPRQALADVLARAAAAVLAPGHRATYDALAPAYDARTGALRPVTQAVVDALTAVVRPGGRVLDVGCGAGLAVRLLTDAGLDASGIELAPAMAAVAAARNPAATIMVGDVMDTDIGGGYDAVLALAFVHLFPKAALPGVLYRLASLLAPGGHLYLGSTDSPQPCEGFEAKADYPGAPARYRAHWGADELAAVITAAGLNILDRAEHMDCYGKRWIDFIATAA